MKKFSSFLMFGAFFLVTVNSHADGGAPKVPANGDSAPKTVSNCGLGNTPIQIGCSISSETIGNSSSAAGFSLANPITCPVITGPTTNCFRVLYCPDKSGLADKCSRTDQLSSNSFAQSSDKLPVCPTTSYHLVEVSGKDICARQGSVSYGAGLSPSHYVTKTLPVGVNSQCSNGTFGSDPFPNAHKACYDSSGKQIAVEGGTFKP